MTDPGCAICAEALARLDVLLALIEQAARGAVIAAVPELAAAVAGAVDVLGVEVEVTEPGHEQPEVLP
jgi:hypothetical protein